MDDYAWVFPYLKIPHVDGGRDEHGADCYGWLRLVLEREAGIVLPVYSVSSSCATSVDRALVDEIQHWSEVTAGEERAFNVALMLTLDAGPMRLGHFGLILRPGLLAHSEAATGPIIRPFRSTPNSDADRLTAKRVQKIMRFEGIKNDRTNQ